MEVCMKSIFSAAFSGAVFALLMVCPAQALDEHICLGQDTFTGVVLNPVTIESAGFLCSGEDVHASPSWRPRATLPPLIHVQFKDTGTRVKVGETLTLKGSLHKVNDVQRQLGGWLLQGAEIVKSEPATVSNPSPGVEAALHRYIDSLEKSAPNYGEMHPELAREIDGRTSWILGYIQQVGALKSLRFLFSDQNGINVYGADFEHGSAEWLIAPLDESGKVRVQGFIPLPASLQCLSVITYMADGPLGYHGQLPYARWQCRQWGG
jgi:hypothetical protein